MSIRSLSSKSLPSLQALVYDDEGVDQPSTDALVKQLRSILDQSIKVKKVNSTYLITNSWENKTIVLIMGGGVCSKWDQQLGEIGIQKIRNYIVEKGGNYIGFCAGAYFACAETNFQLINQPLIHKKRSLSLFDGRAIGPIIPTNNYRSLSSAIVARVSFETKELSQSGSLYYQGGCFFDIHQDSEQTKIIARYQHLTPQLPAAIQCTAGKGKAFLCGLHPEFSWSGNLKMGSNRTFLKLASTLATQEFFRKRVWEQIGKLLSLPLKPNLKIKGSMYSNL